MKIPKKPKTLLKLLIGIATEGVDVMSDPNLTSTEYYALGAMLAGIQNDLGENTELLTKYNLEYKG